MALNYDFNLRMFLNVVAAITLLVVAQAHAADLQVDLKSYPQDENSSENPNTEYLTAGAYVVTPIDDLYTSLNVWGEVLGCVGGVNCTRGWLYSYNVDVISGSGIELEYRLPPSTSFPFGTPIQAFEAAEVAEFTVDADGDVDFYIQDSYYPDNWGGISIVISPKDEDGDGHADVDDNCINEFNPAQDDTDADDCGNLCDADYNNNGTVDFLDFGAAVAAFGSGEEADEDKCHIEPIPGCTVGFLDFGFTVVNFGEAPGPSGTTAGTQACPIE